MTMIGKKVHAALLASSAWGALLVAHPALANPQGGKVVDGAAQITGEGTNVVTVSQSSDRAVIDWRGFSIGAGELTTFAQNGANAIALNRVSGGDPSTILGNLQANGRVFLINPNGVVFGSSAKIDVAGILATTADINTSDFMAGGNQLRFGTPGNTGASIVNHGQITAGTRALRLSWPRA